MPPYSSIRQERWAHSPSGEKALGADEVAEFDRASKGKKLPKTAKHPAHEQHDQYPMAKHVSRVTRK
jgi:hypothetical protein